MAATEFWSLEDVKRMIEEFSKILKGEYLHGVSNLVGITTCGDYRRNPSMGQFKYFSSVVTVDKEEDVELARQIIEHNLRFVYPGIDKRSYRGYDYCALPDGTGSVSWLVVPIDCAGTAMIHATGPNIFISMMEMFCETLQATFKPTGIVTKFRDKVNFETEEEVFEYLGIKYVPPAMRDKVEYLDPV